MKTEYTMKEAAEYLGIKYAALRYIIASKMHQPLFALRDGKKIFYHNDLYVFKKQTLQNKIDISSISTDEELSLEVELLSMEQLRIANKIKDSVHKDSPWNKLSEAMHRNSLNIKSFVSSIK